MKMLGSLCVAIGFSVLLIGSLPGTASASEIVSLTQATPCPSTNGNGGNWCQGNGGPPFNLSSFMTQNITTTGSAGFFVIDNNTGAEVTSLTLDFIGTLENGAMTCGGGGTGIQGSGPGSGSTTCSISAITGGDAITWTNLTWANGVDFDLQIASFSNGTTGVFETPTSPVPELSSLLMLGTGLVGLGGAVKRGLFSRRS